MGLIDGRDGPLWRAPMRAWGGLMPPPGRILLCLLVAANIFALNVGAAFGLAPGHPRTLGACLLIIGATCLLRRRALMRALAISSLIYMYACRLLMKAIVYLGGACLLAVVLIGCLDDDLETIHLALPGVILLWVSWFLAGLAEWLFALVAGWCYGRLPAVPGRVEATIATDEQAQAEADRLLLDDYRAREGRR